MGKNRSTLIKMLISMVLFGTIGLFVREINMPSAMIAMVRGYIGAAFLFFALRGQGKSDRAGVKSNFIILALSGAAIGFNWILLFEAYRYTTIACATLAYYMQPVFVTIASIIILREKTGISRLLCTAAAVCGMVFIS